MSVLEGRGGGKRHLLTRPPSDVNAQRIKMPRVLGEPDAGRIARGVGREEVALGGEDVALGVANDRRGANHLGAHDLPLYWQRRPFGRGVAGVGRKGLRVHPRRRQELERRSQCRRSPAGDGGGGTVAWRSSRGTGRRPRRDHSDSLGSPPLPSARRSRPRRKLT